jgi:tripartite-type tricarboxylate transporter receptor subunit TctC
MEFMKQRFGLDITHVPYRNTPQSIADIAAGHVNMGFAEFGAALPLIRDGKLRALAVSSTTRLPALPDVPTVREAGFPDLIIQDWFGILVKTGTPNDIVVRLNGAMNKALAKPRVRDALAKMAAEPAGGTPAEFGTFHGSELAHWSKVVKDSGIKM